MNDYMAAYHDAVLLIGQMMRKIVEKNHSDVQQMDFFSVNFFRGISFTGKEERERTDMENLKTKSIKSAES